LEAKNADLYNSIKTALSQTHLETAKIVFERAKKDAAEGYN